MDTPLEHTLKTCRNMYIPDTAEIAEMLLEKGEAVTEEMRKNVTRIGTEFEFYRTNIVPEYLEEIECGLQKLYRLFSVEPVPQRMVYDGQSPIAVKADTWQMQHNEFRKLTAALEKYLKMGQPAEKEVLSLAKGIGVNSTEEELFRLNEACVKWVLANPNPIKLDSVSYKR